MKRIYFIICSLVVLFTACQDEFYNATYISNTEISAHSSTADILIYVCDQDGQRTRATVEEFGVFLSTNANPTDKDERHSLVIKGDNWNVYRQVYNEVGGYVFTVEGLSANTTYYALPFISNRWGIVTGKVVSFTTNGTAKVTTKAATQVTATTAQLNATVELAGEGVSLEKRGFVMSTSNNPTIEDNNSTNWAEVGKTGDYGVKYTGLQSSTRYYYRGYVVVDGETLYGNVLNFTTLTPDDAITLSLNNATDITNNSAKVSGSITIGKDAVGQISECGFIATTNNNPTFNSSWYRTWYFNSTTNSDFSTWSGQKNLSGTFSSLSQNTLYYYRMYYKIGSQYYYDTTIKSFRTAGSSQSYYTVSQIMSVYNSLGLASGATSTDTYTVRGYVTKWNSGYPDYQNADFFIDDSANGSTSNFKCFRLTGVNESDKRTLVVGDYIEAQNCHLMNYNGQAELKDGTFTVIKAASQGSTLGSQISDFVGTWSCYEYNQNNSSYETHEGVEIYTWTNSNTNTEWIAVSGLAGYSDQEALGEYDATNKVLRLYTGLYFERDAWTYEDTTYIDSFYPVCVVTSGNTWNGYYISDGGKDGNGEAWLSFNSNGQLVLGASNSADTNGRYANGYAFAQYVKDYANGFRGWYSVYTNVTLTKTSSYVSAPARRRIPIQWHAPMKLPAKMQGNKTLRRR